MRRLIWIALAVAIVPWLVIGVVDATGEEDRGDSYFVRAIFDNASSLVVGEDVKIAGAVVGVVDGLEVAPGKKAAVTLRIDDEDFTPWRQDASCTIRPQSLIGEKFVECKPGTTAAPKLRTLASGDGEGERYLPVQNNSSPVDLDLLNNTLRLPYRERLTILLNEFGTGLAGRGETLNAVIHRSNPALRETDELLAILAKQNKTLSRLAKDSDQALGPIAREREHVSDFIVQATATGQATAERAGDIQLGIERLPGFLRELRPLMVDLDSLAKQGIPVVDDLGEAASSMGPLIKGLGTVSEASNKSFPSLGDALETGRPDLIRTRPLIKKLVALGKPAKPAVKNLDKLTASLQDTDGIQRINDFLYYLTLSTNGYDSLGHYLRAGLVVSSSCSNYSLVPPNSTDCHALFYDPQADASTASTPDSIEARNAKAPDKLATGGSVAPQGSLLQKLIGTPDTKAQAQQREQSLKRLREGSRSASPALRNAEPVLDYLLGGER